MTESLEQIDELYETVNEENDEPNEEDPEKIIAQLQEKVMLKIIQ